MNNLLKTMPRECWSPDDKTQALAQIFDGDLSDGKTIFGDKRGHYGTKLLPPFMVGGDVNNPGGITLNYAEINYEEFANYFYDSPSGGLFPFRPVGDSVGGSTGNSCPWRWDWSLISIPGWADFADNFYKSTWGAMFPVLVTPAGGSSGNLACQCSYTYTVTNLKGDAMAGGAAVSPEKNRPPVGPMLAGGTGDYGTGFFDAGVFKLFDANETLDAAGCST